MISTSMADRLNDQLNKEFYSAYLYLAVSANCSSCGFNGAANWFYIQYLEENTHALKLFRYLGDQNVKVELKAIAAPHTNYESLLDFFEQSLAHEQKMTDDLNELSDFAFHEKDHATYNLLQWYVTEQVEEEAAVIQIIDQIKIVGDSGLGLLTIDKDLASRAFIDSTV